MWGGEGSVGVVKLGLLPVTISWLAGNAAEASGLSAHSLIFADYFGNVWSSGDGTSLTDSSHGNLNFRRVICFRFLSVSISVLISTSGIAAELRPPRVRDLRTMEEVDSTRLTSLERVIRGVGSVSGAAHIEADSHGRLLWPTLPDDVVFMIFYRKFTVLLDSESTQIATKITTLPRIKYEANSTYKSWEY